MYVLDVINAQVCNVTLSIPCRALGSELATHLAASTRSAAQARWRGVRHFCKWSVKTHTARIAVRKSEMNFEGKSPITVVREIFAYRNFHVLIFRVKKFSDIVYLSEKFLTRNFKYE